PRPARDAAGNRPGLGRLLLRDRVRRRVVVAWRPDRGRARAWCSAFAVYAPAIPRWGAACRRLAGRTHRVGAQLLPLQRCASTRQTRGRLSTLGTATGANPAEAVYPPRGLSATRPNTGAVVGSSGACLRGAILGISAVSREVPVRAR